MLQCKDGGVDSPGVPGFLGLRKTFLVWDVSNPCGWVEEGLSGWRISAFVRYTRKQDELWKRVGSGDTFCQLHPWLQVTS